MLNISKKNINQVVAHKVFFGEVKIFFGEVKVFLEKCCFGSFNLVFGSKSGGEGWWNIGWEDRNVGLNG